MLFSHTILLILFIVSSTAVAEDAYESSYIDDTYNIVSDKVIDTSEYIDNSINNMFENSDKNTTLSKIDETYNKEQSIDSFFRNKKFIEETDETYISVKMNSIFNSKDANKYNIRVNARIPLSKSTKRYNLFINNFNKDDTNNLIAEQSNGDSGTEIGVNYFAPLFHQIKSRYSIGANGLNLFTVARYSIEKKFYSWEIQTAQRFKYSVKSFFEEETDVYFDKQLAASKLFRLTLSRGTQEKNSGMDYSLTLGHYWSFNKTTALNLSQLFSGNTKYEYSTNNQSLPQETKKDSGITNYTTALSFRKSAWRKWFFYGITPSVNFNKERDYKVNYELNFYLEFYFGHLK